MVFTDRSVGIIKLGLGNIILLYMFFILIIVPLLPTEDTIFETLTPPSYLLMVCGMFGFVFIGSLSLFTLIVMLYK